MRFHIHIALLDSEAGQYGDVTATFTLDADSEDAAQERLFLMLLDVEFEVTEIEEA